MRKPDRKRIECVYEYIELDRRRENVKILRTYKLDHFFRLVGQFRRDLIANNNRKSADIRELKGRIFMRRHVPNTNTRCYLNISHVLRNRF